MNNNNPPPSTSPPSTLHQRATTLLTSLHTYQTHLQTHHKQHDVEIRTFKKGIEAETKALKSFTDPLPNPNPNLNSSASNASSVSGLTEFEIEELESRRNHALRSSNLPFYEAVWRIMGGCGGVVALQRKVFCDVNPMSTSKTTSISMKGLSGHVDGNGAKKSRTERQTAVVDIIAQDGLEWIKVSTITEKRLLFEMAKEGWEAYGDHSEEDYDSDDGGLSTDKRKDEGNQLELVKLAKILYAASRQERARFRRPRVRFVFTKLCEGVYKDVDAVIADIRTIGIHVICEGSGIERDLTDLTLNGHALEQQQQHQQNPEQLIHLLPSPSLLSYPPTPTLNIDCTILLALISDISHIHTSNLPPFPDNVSKAYHKTISRQISSENQYPLLINELYPYLADRKLVCTDQAAQRMREIVQTMGTQTERVRADILLGEGSRSGVLHEDLCAAMQEFSCHHVPDELRLPIQIVEFDYSHDMIGSDTEIHKIDDPSPKTSPDLSVTDTRIMSKISQKMNLSPINTSVFLYGWRQSVVTVTSNRVVASGIVKCINEILDEEEAEAEADTETRNGTGNKAGEEADTPFGPFRKDPPEHGDFESNSDPQFQGPKIYVCETARSLIGKEKQTKVHRG